MIMKIFGKEFSFGMNKAGGRRLSFSSISPERVVLLTTIFSLLLLIAIVAWDGYVFYALSQRESAAGVGPNPARIVSASQIDEAVKVLDDREKKSNEILGQ